MSEPRTVVVYSRKGCHLCEVVKESLGKLSRRGGFTWQEIDVDTDNDLRRQFNDEVPMYLLTVERLSNTTWTSRNFSEGSSASYLSNVHRRVSINRHTRVFTDTLSLGISS
jgi:hypothetical protein